MARGGGGGGVVEAECWTLEDSAEVTPHTLPLVLRGTGLSMGHLMT